MNIEEKAKEKSFFKKLGGTLGWTLCHSVLLYSLSNFALYGYFETRERGTRPPVHDLFVSLNLFDEELLDSDSSKAKNYFELQKERSAKRAFLGLYPVFFDREK